MRDQVRMSWVTLDRFCQEEAAKDEPLRRKLEADNRPLRSSAAKLTDGELLDKLRSMGFESAPLGVFPRKLRFLWFGSEPARAAHPWPVARSAVTRRRTGLPPSTGETSTPMTPDQAFDFYAQPEIRRRRDRPADGMPPGTRG